MIKNKRQYVHSKNQAAQFHDALQRARSSPCPADVHPRMHQAFIEGMEGELETLQQQIREYEALATGSVELIQLDRLEKLPQGLIKARIARGLSHKELADRLGIKAQQIQRWEHEDYENVGFSRLVKIAHALDVGISENIFLPRKGRTALAALKSFGIDKQFLLSRLVPVWSGGVSAGGDAVLAAAERLSRIFGIEVLSEGGIAYNHHLAIDEASVRFKLPSNAEGNRTRAYAMYAAYLAELVAKWISIDNVRPIPTTWQTMRSQLFQGGPIDYVAALRQAWELGVPVIPLSDPIRLHGCCVRSRGRTVIVLKQSVRYTSRWLFDLVHELYHAAEDPLSVSSGAVHEGVSDANWREAESERAANEFAGNVLLNGRADALYREVLELASYQVIRIKFATTRVSAKHSEHVGLLANYVAHRLKVDHFVDWWGTAANLQPNSDDAFEITRRVFFEKVSTKNIVDEDKLFIEQALSEPSL